MTAWVASIIETIDIQQNTNTNACAPPPQLDICTMTAANAPYRSPEISWDII